MSSTSLGFPQLWDGVESEIGATHVWDVPGLPVTLGWNGQWDWKLHSATLRHVPGCPASWYSGMDGFEPSAVRHLGHVRMSLGFPGFWDGIGAI